jgi:hypothetical protein
VNGGSVTICLNANFRYSKHSTARHPGAAADELKGAEMQIRAARRRAVFIAESMILALAVASAGCSSNAATRDYNLVFTKVDALEYANILCSGIDMQDRHTCLTSVMQHVKDMRERSVTPREVLDGPFVVVLRNDLYQGNYVSQPFAAAFTVSNGINICRGRYNAFAGDTKAIFKVRCDDGATGSANIMLDAAGRNGVGIVDMDDGTRGAIVFGHAAVGGAFL